MSGSSGHKQARWVSPPAETRDWDGDGEEGPLVADEYEEDRFVKAQRTAAPHKTQDQFEGLYDEVQETK